MKKIVVIFANSVKFNNHCVAGKDILTKQWIRPVSTREGAELSDKQVKYVNPMGRFTVKPLQKIEIGFSEKASILHQPENHVINEDEWVQRYNINIDEIEEYLDTPNDLWGCADSIDSTSVRDGNVVIKQSLYLVRVSNVELYTREYDGKLRRRVSFEYNGIEYDLSVTDPNFDNILNHNNVLCISLGGEYNSRHYKIVAAIL